MSVVPTPIPVAFCITELDRGGAELAMTQLVLGLDRTEWLPRVYCLGPQSYFAEVIRSGGVNVECFNAAGMTTLPRVLIQLTMAFRRFRPALLQTFLFHGNLIGRLAGRLARVPRIVSGIRVADRHNHWHGHLDRFTNALVDHNVCVSDGVAEFAISHSGLNAQKISVIPNGVDFNRFAAAEPANLQQFGIPNGATTLITVGRLEEQKGIDILLRAASVVLTNSPSTHFLIVGDGPDRQDLQSLAKRLGIANSVHFVGARDDVPGLLAASTVFVLPSRWEGMPNALLEAMSAGLPVIATAAEGSRDLVHTGRTGMLVTPGLWDELAKVIQQTLGQMPAAKKMAISAQSLVNECYTTEIVSTAYGNLYRRLLHHH